MYRPACLRGEGVRGSVWARAVPYQANWKQYLLRLTLLLFGNIFYSKPRFLFLFPLVITTKTRLNNATVRAWVLQAKRGLAQSHCSWAVLPSRPIFISLPWLSLEVREDAFPVILWSTLPLKKLKRETNADPDVGQRHAPFGSKSN